MIVVNFPVKSICFYSNYSLNPLKNDLKLIERIKKFTVFFKKDLNVYKYFSFISKHLITAYNYNFSLFINKKTSFIYYKVFISTSQLKGLGFSNFNKELLVLNKSIYFFNINKLIFMLSQFSSFFLKLIYLRGQIIFTTFDTLDYNFIQSISYSTGQNYLSGKWINGLFTNWVYFYRKLWESEQSILRSLQEKKFYLKMSKDFFFGLLGLRNLPDFIFIFNPGNEIYFSNFIKESFEYNLPVSAVLNSRSENRFILYPLFGDINNISTKNFYKLLLIKLYKLGLLKRLVDYKV